MELLHEIDSYSTPDSAKRVIADKIFLGTSIYFIYGYLKEVIKAQIQAKKGSFKRKDLEKASFRVMKNIEKCGGKIHIENLDNIKKVNGPVVFVSNHMSTLESFVFPYIISPIHKMSFIVKDSLIKHPLFSAIMKSCDPIVVGRKNPREDLKVTMEQGKERLKNGISMVVFPQATRTDEFIPSEFNTLGVKLAKSAGVKVIPIAIKTDFWSNRKIIKDLAKVRRDLPVHIKFGEAMDINGNGKEEHKKIIKFIQENFDKWKKNDK